MLIVPFFWNEKAIVMQLIRYGTARPIIAPGEDDILEQALRLEEEEQNLPRGGIVE